jgi:hypothetical protein
MYPLGYGIIGGIMMFDLMKMRTLEWYEKILIPNILSYSEMKNKMKSFSGDVSSNYIWNAKLNDQDIFNAFLSILPNYLHILPCEWNVQFHARINTAIICAHHILDNKRNNDNDNDNNSNNDNNDNHHKNDDMVRDNGTYPNILSIFNDQTSNLEFFKSNMYTTNDIPLNCDESKNDNIFVCTKRASVLHFMAQSYNENDFMRYYSGFWDSYSNLSWSLIFDHTSV